MTMFRYSTIDGELFLDPTAANLTMNDQGGSVVDAQASVESGGEIRRRVTATRVMLTGAFALAWQKKLDNRELYILVDAPTYSMVARVDPSEGVNARRFTAAINAVAKGGELRDLLLLTPTKSLAVSKEAQQALLERQLAEMNPGQRRAYARKLLIKSVIALAAAVLGVAVLIFGLLPLIRW